jgi:hypothetical protein
VKDVPDDYTAAFQQEMVDRAMERMAALRADGGDEGRGTLRSACARIRDFFGPYWLEVEADQAADVTRDVEHALANGLLGQAADLLFPPGPPEVDTDLTVHGTEYEYICRDVTDELADELAQPPGTPLPPPES